MKKREWGALSFRVRKGTSLFFAGLLCFAMPAMAHAVEMSGEGQTEARPAKAVVENEPADDDALAIIAEEADVAEFGIAVSAQPEIRPEDADAGNAADNAEDSGDVVPDERESGLFPEGSSFRYQYADGTFAVDTWVVADDVRYYFGADGLAVAGRQKIEDCWYFFDDGCRMQTGWVTWKNGTKSFFDWDGRALTGWRSFNGVKYYFDPSTAMSLRWSQKLDGSWYYFDSDSKMVKGWVTWKNGTKSFFDWDGRALTGWRSFNGVKYYFDPSGHEPALEPEAGRLLVLLRLGLEDGEGMGDLEERHQELLRLGRPRPHRLAQLQRGEVLLRPVHGHEPALEPEAGWSLVLLRLCFSNDEGHCYLERWHEKLLRFPRSRDRGLDPV